MSRHSVSEVWPETRRNKQTLGSDYLPRGLTNLGTQLVFRQPRMYIMQLSVYYAALLHNRFDTMHKKDRHDTILEMISAAPVKSQAELASELCKRGFSVTQASVSRDLDELGVTKIGGRYVRSIPTTDGGIAARASFETAGPYMIVGKCASGLASAITVRIDSLQFPEIVGTIAGDDTIMIAVKSEEAQSAALARLTKIFG